MGLRQEVWESSRVWAAGIIGITALGLAAFFFFRQPGNSSQQLSGTAGRADGPRHQIAELLSEEARSQGLDFRLQETSGSEEALDRVNEGVLDVALVQGGLGTGHRLNVRQVAALHVEPLHLLVKSELFSEVEKSLTGLKGKVINLGEPGSGSHTLALEVLRFAGLPPDSYTAATLSYRNLQAGTKRDDLPDAAFMVQSLPSPIARHLIARQDYRLVPLTFAEAFALSAFDRSEAAPSGGLRVERSFIHDTVIPAYTYGVEPPVPPQPVHTLGARLLVVAHKAVDPRAIDRLLEAIFASSFAQVSRLPPDPLLLEKAPEFPLHEGTKAYVQRNTPLIAADVVDYSEKLMAIAATVVGGLFFLWQGLRQWHQRRQQRQFRQSLATVANIEQRALELERAAQLDLRAMLRLQQELNELKDEVLGKFARNELQGEQLISGFLTLVNDARNHLTRLILHERENLEQQAEHQGRQATDVWSEAVNPPSTAAAVGGELPRRG